MSPPATLPLRSRVVRPFLRLSVRPSVCYQTCERDILKVNKPISMQIGTSGLQVKDIKWSTFGVRTQEVIGQGHTMPK